MGKLNRYLMRLLMVLMLFLAACDGTSLQPWERDLLAKTEMQLVHPFDTAYDEHIYFSKEATSGGQGFTAGGCGCN